jgi:hypothetical protein
MQQETSEDPRLIDIPQCIDLIVITYLTTICLRQSKFKVAFVTELTETVTIASIFQNITG